MTVYMCLLFYIMAPYTTNNIPLNSHFQKQVERKIEDNEELVVSCFFFREIFSDFLECLLMKSVEGKALS